MTPRSAPLTDRSLRRERLAHLRMGARAGGVVQIELPGAQPITRGQAAQGAATRNSFVGLRNVENRTLREYGFRAIP